MASQLLEEVMKKLDMVIKKQDEYEQLFFKQKHLQVKIQKLTNKRN